MHLMMKYQSYSQRYGLSIVDDAIDYLKTTAEVPLDTLNMHGKLKYKGYMKYGGRYPG